jgi:hypothetical protein
MKMSIKKSHEIDPRYKLNEQILPATGGVDRGGELQSMKGEN